MSASLAVLESVRCLECGSVYGKPRGGGTSEQNPGCPECGYVGWLAATIPFNVDGRQPRPVADRLQRLRVRSH
jgi:predicted  nucleic acid-binding Zn-ribbon protein